MRFVETRESRERTARMGLYVWPAKLHAQGSTWYSWRVETVHAAKEMVRHARRSSPREYPLAAEWVVTKGERGPVVATFTTKEAVGI